MWYWFSSTSRNDVRAGNSITGSLPVSPLLQIHQEIPLSFRQGVQDILEPCFVAQTLRQGPRVSMDTQDMRRDDPDHIGRDTGDKVMG